MSERTVLEKAIHDAVDKWRVDLKRWDVSISVTDQIKLEEAIESAVTATQPPASDDGWVRVPREPTREMQKAYFDAIDKNLERVSTDPRFGRFDNHREAYRAMLAAAPQPGEGEERE